MSEVDDEPSGGILGFARQWLPPLLMLPLVFHGMGWLRAPSLPTEAPAFALSNLQGETVSLADLKGKTVVLNFWATWCGPCRVEAPGFAAFADANPDIVVLGIAADGPAPLLAREGKQLGITYPILQGTAEVFEDYGVNTFPTTVVVGPDGHVETAYTGMMTRPQLWWATR